MAISSALTRIIDFALVNSLETYEELDFLIVRRDCLTLIHQTDKQVEHVDNRYGRYWPFEKARVYARKQKLKTVTEWREYAKSQDRIREIPSNPQTTYKDEWKNWGDWLGNQEQFEEPKVESSTSVVVNGPYPQTAEDWYSLWDDLRELVWQFATNETTTPRVITLTVSKKVSYLQENGVVVQIQGTFRDLVLQEVLHRLQTVRVETCFVCRKMFLCEKSKAKNYCSSKCYHKFYNTNYRKETTHGQI